MSSSFSAGTFNVEAAVESNANGLDWKEFDSTDDSGPLRFQVPAEGMTPGESVYAALSLRVAEGGYAANVSLPVAPVAPPAGSTPQNNRKFFEALKLSLYRVARTSCSAAGTGPGSVVPGFNEVALTTSSTEVVTLPQDREAVSLCFKVTLPANTNPDVRGGTTSPLVWGLRATSVDPD